MTPITELADWTPDVDILGNVGFRRIVLTGHQKLPGHEHNFPHATAVVKGTVAVVFNGERREIHIAPSRFEVPARVRHEITALTDGAECWCIFGVRDESGEIAEMVEDKHRRDKFWHERLGGGDAPNLDISGTYTTPEAVAKWAEFRAREERALARIHEEGETERARIAAEKKDGA